MRLLLRPEVDRPRFDAAIIALDLVLVSVIAARADRPRRVIASARDGRALVSFVEDHRFDARYLEIGGLEPDPLASSLRAHLAIATEEDVRGAIEVSEPEKRAHFERLLAIVTDRSESDSDHEMLELLNHPPFDLPQRPRLSRTVRGRRHIRDGEDVVILDDARTGRTLLIDPPSWRALELADGTRDLDALCLALASEGLYQGEADLTKLIVELTDLGALVDGLPQPDPPPPVARETTPPGRALEPLPGFRLSCDGRGSCCRFYGSVSFTPLEALRAKTVAPSVRLPEQAIFTPLSGAQAHGDLAVALVDGACLYLDRAGRCELHHRGGPDAKPRACRVYPTTMVDDGERVRVSLGPECACVYASIGRSDGDPLVPIDARVLGDLDGAQPMHVPDPVPLSRLHTTSRARWREHSTWLFERIADHPQPPALLWSIADGLEASGVLRDSGSTVEIDRIAQWLAALAAQLHEALESHRAARGASDLSRRTATWMLEAIDHADLPTLWAISPIEAERFYLRALVHGHRLAIEGRPIAHGLRDRAVRVIAARAMSAHRIEPIEPSTEYPLALAEAAIRTLGLSGYADELTSS